MKLKSIFLMILLCVSATSKEIPIQIKLEYASKMIEGFHWQAAGQSTIAFSVFDQGYQKAKQNDEDPQKLDLIFRLFAWYRKHGQYLGMMSPYVHDYDQILSSIPNKHMNASVHLKPLSTPEMEARRREFLLGTAEIMSGLLGVSLLPHPVAKRAAFTIALDGGKRYWKIYQEVKLERDLALYELKQITETVEKMAKE